MIETARAPRPSNPEDQERLTPTVSAVIGAYNAQEWIGETVQAILSQTHPPDELIVVDDGSTDGTLGELRRFGDRIAVLSQRNGGCPAAFNSGFGKARGDFIAMCGADDLWEPTKLERQLAALSSHPQIDVAFGAARVFGSAQEQERIQVPPPGTGVLDSGKLLQTLYQANIVCASSVLISNSLYRRLGPFVERLASERFACDDYDYWLRALISGAVFYYDPEVLVGYRRHEGNATNDQRWINRSRHQVHRWHSAGVPDRALVREVLAEDLFSIARGEVDARQRRAARAAFAASMRRRMSPSALVFLLVLALPERLAWPAIDGLVALKRRLERPQSNPAATARSPEQHQSERAVEDRVAAAVD